MERGGAIFGGILGGLLGAAIWAAVGHWTDYEVGWIAWGIGFLVGVGVRGGSRGRALAGSAVMAGVIAFGAVVAGKWAALTMSVDAQVNEMPIAAIADVVVAERLAAGELIELPSEDGAVSWEDLYPVYIWAEAETRWASLDDMDQAGFKAAMADEMPSMFAMLSPYDLLWLALAVGTATQIVGAGREEEERQHAVALLESNTTGGMAVLPPAPSSKSGEPRAAA